MPWPPKNWSNSVIEAPSPWKRGRDAEEGPPGLIWENSAKHQFDTNIDDNIDLDVNSKRASLRVAKSVVSLVSRIGETEIFMCSGTVVECEYVDGLFCATIMTSASILPTKEAETDDMKVDVYLYDGKMCEGKVSAFDVHYNIAVVKIYLDSAIPTATVMLLDDSVSINLERHDSWLHHHSDLFRIFPGVSVIAVGRYYRKPHKLMVAPGVFSVDYCKLECKELLRGNCRITKCGIGGPLINQNGEVIGISFYATDYTPFLPMNVAWKWWNHFKVTGEYRRPWLGADLANLYTAGLDFLEQVIEKFPHAYKGALVEVVGPASPADSAGIRPYDVIFQCGGRNIHSVLELLDVMWENTGNVVEMKLLRASDGAQLQVSAAIQETEAENYYSWPLPKEHMRFKIGRR